MFIGHYAPAFVAATHPKAPGLGTLFVAAQLVDIAFFAFLPLGIEQMRVVPGISVMNPMDLNHMPWTHSLLGAACWATGFGLLVRAITKNSAAGALASLVVLSHWLLDLLVHVPDLTIAGAPPKLGFGLWNHPLVEMPLELALLGGAMLLYFRRTRATAKPWAIGILLAALLVLQAVNWFGAPPTRVDASIWALGLFAYALAAGLAWWVGNYRVLRAVQP